MTSISRPHLSRGRRYCFRSLLLFVLTLITLLAADVGTPHGIAGWAPRVLFGRGFSPWSLGNYANGTVQLSGNATVTPDAPPSATTSINVSTSTNFKGKLEGDPTTGDVRITNAHPAGTYTVTVTGFDGGPSIKTFTATVTTSGACSVLTFAGPTNFALAASPSSVAVGDINRDGKQDIVTTRDGSFTASVLLGDGAGGFNGPTNFAVGNDPRSVTVGDFNGDGRQDLATANFGSANISVILGDGTGNFTAPANFGAGNGPVSVAVGDFNADGKQDLATANSNSSNVSVLLGDGAGSFSAASNLPVGNLPFSVAVGDFNSDGKQDLAVANSNSNNVSVLLGNGAGGFGAATNFGVGSGPHSVVVGDFNGDGKQDLATANQGASNNVSILLGNGLGSFSGATNFAAGSAPIAAAVGDFNGDGKQDLAITNAGSANVSLLLGDGAGSFGAATNFGVGTTPQSVAVGDFDGDGRQDLTTANSGSNNVSVLLRQCPVNFSITGRVLDDSANPLSGVDVNLSGSASATTTTDAGGNYTFGNRPSGGTYTVTPSISNYSFAPVSQTLNNLSANGIANFVGTKRLITISGHVTDAANNPLNNITIKLTRDGSEVVGGTTDVGGNYSINNLQAGATYVVLPTGTFAPANRSFNNLTFNATANFKEAPVIPPQCSSVSFAAPTTFNAGSGPISVAVGDFNADGKLDLAVANNSSANVSVVLGDGSGGFGPPTNLAVGSLPLAIAAADFNNDGKLDLAVTNNNVVMLGNGTGGFSAPIPFTPGAGSDAIAVADFNNDGRLDIAVSNGGSNNVGVSLGSGTGNFGGATNFNVGTNPVAIVSGDFDGDGRVDLVTANKGSSNLSVLLGNGAGGFAPATNLPVATTPTSVAVADFSGDNVLDFAVTDSSNNVTVFPGSGAGAILGGTSYPVGTGPIYVTTGDFNGDGKLDLVVANNTSTNLSVLLGNSDGTFAAAVNFPVSGIPAEGNPVVVADFNGDGKPDMAAANFNLVTVHLNNTTACNTQNSLTISGQVTAANSSPLPDVTVTLSGTITRVVQTDVNGNYSFANLTPGGTYSVTLQSNYFVFAASRADFINLSSNQTPNFIAAPVAVPLPTPPFSDNFNTDRRDPAKWNLGTLSLPAAGLDPRVTTAQVNGQLVIKPVKQATGMHYGGYVSANSFDMRAGKASVELVKAATGGGDTIFSIGSDSDNFYRFLVHTPGAGTTLTQAAGPYGTASPRDATTAQLIFQIRIAGQLTALSIDYDPIQHRFMRFRHEPLTNSIVFETSPNDIDYTVRHSVTLSRSVSALTVELSAGTSNPANPGATVFDNFGLVTSTFQFSASGYTVNEGGGGVSITVTRTGSTTTAATVDFATADGTAPQRTKYINTAGRLTFATGQTSKTFDVLIEDNAHPEGNETVNLLLMNPVGSGLNSPARALLNIIDNDTTPATGNPLDDPRFFVTQNYFDFLNRAPDQGGLDFWMGLITSCPSADVMCVRERRITVSNAFFFELEFQQTGAYVFRLYRTAFGNNQPFPNPDANPGFPGQNLKLPGYDVFARDRAQVVGGSSLSQSQLDLANAFVLRPEFLLKYPASLDGPGFVDAMLATIMNDLGVNLGSQRTALIDLYNQGGQGGRGRVLYRLADDNVQTNPINNRPLIDAEYVRSFVATQYFGYLRRDADIGGFLFWLGQVNSAPLRDLSKQRAMVCSFITSGEYQQRFSPIVTHTNQECQ